MSAFKRYIFSRGVIEHIPDPDPDPDPPIPEGSKVGSGAVYFGFSDPCGGEPGTIVNGQLFLEQNVRDWIGNLTENTTPPPFQYVVTTGLNFPTNGWYSFIGNPSNIHRLQLLNGNIAEIEFC